MEAKLIIGITGRKRAGKDSVALVLKTMGFAVDSFAAPIRHMVCEMLGWGPLDLEQRKEEPLDFLGGVTAREIMQKIGTECGRRMIHPDLWLILLQRRLSKRQHENVVVPDVRFDNEANAIIAAGGFVIEVKRPSTETADAHVSEAGISPSLVHAVIHNVGSLKLLESSTRELIKATARKAA